jgi:hypothetical protein
MAAAIRAGGRVGYSLESLPRPFRVLWVAALGFVPLSPTLLLDKSNELRRQSLPLSENRRQMLHEVTEVACEDDFPLRIQYVCGR